MLFHPASLAASCLSTHTQTHSSSPLSHTYPHTHKHTLALPLSHTNKHTHTHTLNATLGALELRGGISPANVLQPEEAFISPHQRSAQLRSQIETPLSV